MQASATMSSCAAHPRLRRLGASGSRSLAGGLIPFRGQVRSPILPRQSRAAVAVRAQLEEAAGRAIDAIAAGADSVPSLLDSLSAHLSTTLFLLDAAAVLPDGAADAAAAVTEEAAKDKNGGFFGVFSTAFESFLKALDGSLEKMGVPYSYGFAIIFLTLLVKTLTFPLSKKQVESTLGLQAMQPKVKELQAKFANDPERLQVETARLYQNAGVNPLAGCLPALATIPVFIGLYRALSNVADEGLLTEGFFWIPSLAGPTKLNGGLGWLVPVDGVPPLGWGPTIAYLVMPVLLIVSQYASQKFLQPSQQNADAAQQQSNAILKFLPLMIGYFSLNVPSGLTLYWFTNNVVTTLQQIYLRRNFDAANAAVASSGPASSAVIDVTAEELKRPSGKEVNARRSSKSDSAPAAISAPTSGSDSRGEKFRAIRAREAAMKAAEQAAAGAATPPAEGVAQAPERGAKFRAIKAREQASKAAQAAPSSNGAAAAEAGQAAATVVTAEVMDASWSSGEEEEEVGEGHAASSAAGGSNGSSSKKPKGGKKGGKRK